MSLCVFHSRCLLTCCLNRSITPYANPWWFVPSLSRLCSLGRVNTRTHTHTQIHVTADASARAKKVDWNQSLLLPWPVPIVNPLLMPLFWSCEFYARLVGLPMCLSRIVFLVSFVCVDNDCLPLANPLTDTCLQAFPFCLIDSFYKHSVALLARGPYWLVHYDIVNLTPGLLF